LTYIVKEECIKCKHMDCVEVCPVDCFYEGENMLVIHPDECIDCGVCEPECPVEAIVDDTGDGLDYWLELNAKSQKSARCRKMPKNGKTLPIKNNTFLISPVVMGKPVPLLFING